MIIYGDVDSGNCYKIKLLLSLLNNVNSVYNLIHYIGA